MGLVISRFQFALPIFAVLLTVSDIHRIDVIFAKGFKWCLATKFFNVDDIFE